MTFREKVIKKLGGVLPREIPTFDEAVRRAEVNELKRVLFIERPEVIDDVIHDWPEEIFRKEIRRVRPGFHIRRIPHQAKPKEAHPKATSRVSKGGRIR